MRKRLIVSAIALVCSQNTLTQAQTNSASRVLKEEVIVTAQKRQQSIADVPSSVVALSDDFLNKSVAKSFSDIRQLTAGVEISASKDGFAPNLRIRGVGTNANSGVAPSVGIFLNEIPLADLSIAFTNTADYQQVEVLRGPQSTLFGKGVSSGAIAISIKPPTLSENEGFVEANIGEFGLQEFTLGSNVVLGDKVALRGSIYSTEEDGGFKNALNGDKSETRDNVGGRFQLLYVPAEELSVKLSYEKHELETSGVSQTVTEYGDGSQALAAVNGISLEAFGPFSRKQQDAVGVIRTNDTDVASLRIEWDIDERWSFTSLFAYQDWTRINDSSRGVDDVGFDTIVGPQLYQFGSSVTEADMISQEFRLLYTGEKLTSMTGVFYSDSETTNIADIARPLRVPLTALGYLAIRAGGEDQKTEDWAIFTHNTYELTPQLDFTLGLRYSEVDREGGGGNILGAGQYSDLHDPLGVTGIPLTTMTPITEKGRWDTFTGKLALTYALDADLSLYASLDSGFKAGNFGSQTVIGDEVTPGTPFDEETGTSVEIGVKGEFLDNKLRWNTAIFHQEYDDYQVGIVDPVTAQSLVSNAGEVTVEGIESELSWLLTEHLVIDGSIAYIDSRFTDYEGAPCISPQYSALACTGPGGTQDLSDERVNNVSPLTANLNITWSNTLSNGADWYIRGEGVYRDERTFASDLDPSTKAPDYYLFNASVGYTTPSRAIDIILWAKNLFDEEYYNEIRSNSDGITEAGLRASPGSERTFGVNLRYSF